MRRTPLEDAIIVPHLQDPDPHPQYKKGGGAALSDDLPAAETVADKGTAGTAAKASRSDHQHPMPGLASAIASGFMSSGDKIKLDTLISETARGATWYAGTGAPGVVGVSGDFYFDHATADIYANVGDVWTLEINLIGTWLAAIATSGSGADLAAGSVALAKIANEAAFTLLGNNTGSPAAPAALTQTQIAALLADWKAQLLYDFKANVVADATTAITLAATHRGSVLTTSNGSAVTVTLPNSLEVGFSVTVVQGGAGQITFAAASGATLSNRQAQTKTAGQYAMVTLLVIANSDGSSAAYVLAGDTA